MARRIFGGSAELPFKVLAGGLGLATVYLTGVCAVNLYRGFSWHYSQPKTVKDVSQDGSQ